MELKLFGKSIFEFGNSRAEVLMNQGMNRNRESKHLPDFYRDLGLSFDSMVPLYTLTPDGGIINSGAEVTKKGGKRVKPKTDIKLTPKGVHELKLLHEQNFTIKTDPKYIDEQLADFKERLNMVKKEEYDMNRGVIEIQSILIRLENRKSYPKFEKFFSDYAYTTSAKIKDVLDKNDNLKMGQIAQFVADLPKEAINVMKDYTVKVKELCGKEPVYYIIAEKKDFEKTTKRRDPILLAQSPFGHFWQILGAWDKEMLLLEDL